MKFNRATFWVQVHDIPIRFRTREVAEEICGAIRAENEAPVDVEVEGDGLYQGPSYFR